MKRSVVDEGYNHIKQWLCKKLDDRKMSVDRFCVASGSRLDPTSIRRWFSDASRPYPEKMKIVCETLSRLPVYRKDGSQFYEEVPWSEGMSKYKPKPRAWEAHYINRPTPSPSSSQPHGSKGRAPEAPAKKSARRPR